MRPAFVPTSNVRRFAEAINKLMKPEDRGAREAGILLVQGKAGLGKSETGAWWALQNNAISLRLKAAGTPHWMLNDLVTELAEAPPARSCEDLFKQAIASLAKNPRPIVVDEVEQGLGNLKILETLRDISDFTEVPLIFLGREFVHAKLKRHSQFHTRLGAAIEFKPLTQQDVFLCCAQMADVEIAPDLAKKIHVHCEGYAREVVKAIRNVELVAFKRKLKAMSAADMDGHHLTPDPTELAGRRGEDQVAA